MKRRLTLIVAALFIAISSMPFVSPQVAAQPANIDCSDQSSAGLEKIRDFYRLNDITGYDVCAILLSGFCPPGGAASSTIPAGDTNAERAFKYLITKGLTANQAAGIVGNLMQESGGNAFNIDPEIENGIGAFGIVQWLGGRKTGLLSYAQRQGKPATDLGIQLDYMWIELTGLYKSSTLDPIRASSDLVTPTKIFLMKYEIPCVGEKGCADYLATRLSNAQKAHAAFASLAPGEVTATEGTDPTCAGGNEAAGTVDASGYAFPVILAKSLVSNGFSWPCRTGSPYCHHDGTPAFDLSKKPDNKTAGVPIVAIYPGKIIKIGLNYKGTGCQSIQYKADDGHNYWYGHIRTDSKTPGLNSPVTAGTYLGRVGERICTGNGSYPHLHIDMARKGETAGYPETRDPAFVPLMNSLYANLTESP
jgi:hypothetical protein